VPSSSMNSELAAAWFGFGEALSPRRSRTRRGPCRG
jgi:hypothetical protein